MHCTLEVCVDSTASALAVLSTHTSKVQCIAIPPSTKNDFEWPPRCFGHFQRNEYFNLSMGKSADFPIDFFTGGESKGKVLLFDAVL